MGITDQRVTVAVTQINCIWSSIRTVGPPQCKCIQPLPTENPPCVVHSWSRLILRPGRCRMTWSNLPLRSCCCQSPRYTLTSRGTQFPLNNIMTVGCPGSITMERAPHRYQVSRNSTHPPSQTENSSVQTAPWPVNSFSASYCL